MIGEFFNNHYLAVPSACSDSGPLRVWDDLYIIFIPPEQSCQTKKYYYRQNYILTKINLKINFMIVP